LEAGATGLNAELFNSSAITSKTVGGLQWRQRQATSKGQDMIYRFFS
jgi:hypothetical protein